MKLTAVAVVSRPDVAYTVSALSQLMQRYNESHWTAAVRVLRYLKGAPDLGIMYDGYSMSDVIDLEVFADSDFCRRRTDTKIKDWSHDHAARRSNLVVQSQAATSDAVIG